MDQGKKCQVCGSSDWKSLPDPHPSQCVTTAGRIVNQPLGKSQCNSCGFVQRVRASFLGFTDYYEQDYANYYERPGTEKFHYNRYKVMIEWMNRYLLDGNEKKKALDVGCGQGWAIQVMKGLYPKLTIEGIEPSSYNVKKARDKGFTVHEGKLEDANLALKSYDLIFSNNVIQHVNNAESFLMDLKKLLTDDGVIIVTCPDGSRPNIEILWGDQNFSFLPQHLIALAEKTGFKYTFWTSSPENPALPPAQLLVLSNNDKYASLKIDRSNPNIHLNIDEIFEKRSAYLNSFTAINSLLKKEISGAKNVYNLGASYWTSVLAAYCPDYWPNVSAIALDESNETPTFLNKKVINSAGLLPSEKETLVLGIAPASQGAAKKKLEKEWRKVVSWDNLIHY